MTQQKKYPRLASLKIALVVVRNGDIVDASVHAAVRRLISLGAVRENMRIMEVRALFHVPLLVKSIAESREFDGVLVIAAPVRDAHTDTYDLVVPEVVRALMDIMMTTSLPIGCGIVAAQDLRRVRRALSAADNDVVRAATALADLLAA